GCTGRSCRTANDRELVRFGARVARVELTADAADGQHLVSVGIEPGERKRMRVDGVAVERLVDVEARPLAAVFLPDRLELVKGPPALAGAGRRGAGGGAGRAAGLRPRAGLHRPRSPPRRPPALAPGPRPARVRLAGPAAAGAPVAAARRARGDRRRPGRDPAGPA